MESASEISPQCSSVSDRNGNHVKVELDIGNRRPCWAIGKQVVGRPE
jgi:hypothetical protein